MNARTISTGQESTSEHPASRSGTITVRDGFRIFAVSAMKCTPQKTMTSASAACAATVKEPAFEDSMKKQATDVRYLDRKAYAAWLKENDELNKTLARDLGLLKR